MLKPKPRRNLRGARIDETTEALPGSLLWESLESLNYRSPERNLLGLLNSHKKEAL